MNAERSEEEDVFLDAYTSPEEQPRELRRSTRKRKSLSEVDDQKTPKAGKRHRPLGKIGGVQRSPEGPNNGKKSVKSQERRSMQGASPSISTGATLTVETDPPTPTPTAEQLVLLGGMRAVLKEELSITEKRLTGRIADVEVGLNTVKADVRSLESRLDAVEDQVRTGESGRRLDDDGFSLSGRVDSVNNNARQLRYWKARRSLRMWPIRGDGEDLRIELQKFLTHKLRLGEDVLTDTKDYAIRKIPSGSSRAGKIVNEVTVEFPSTELRDVVRGAAFNLAGQSEAGIRLEIPHHLMSNFKALNAASYRLKTKFAGCKRNIKYDDDCNDLILDFKTNNESGWRRLRPSQAKGLLRDEGGLAEEMTAADMTGLLAQDEADGGTDGEEEEH